MNFNLSEHSSEVVGWDSTLITWETDREVMVKDSSTETSGAEVKSLDKGTGTQEDAKSAGCQTTPTVFSNSNEETDRKLAAWLKKIYPALEKELTEGPTEVHEPQEQVPNGNFIKVTEYQEVDVKSNFENTVPDTIVGSFAWLSVILQNNPALIISCACKSELNDSAYVLLFEPCRNKIDGNVYWKEQLCLPVKEKLEHLVVNSDNRDMFAGASRSSLYIWEYSRSSDDSSKVTEIFSKHGEDAISGLTFCTDNTLVCCFGTDGNITSYKIISKHSCTVDKQMKIDERSVKSAVAVTSIANIHKTSDFVVGLLSGKILYCTLIQPAGLENPVIKQLTSHKFAVKSLKHVQQSSMNLVISFDASSEIFVHELDEDSSDKSLKYVIRLPLPIKNSIAFSSSLEYIFCPLPSGNLEVFNGRNHTRRIVEGNKSGSGVLAELSKNESWLITGIYKGTFKIYHVSQDE